jgi:hypothetical protein
MTNTAPGNLVAGVTKQRLFLAVSMQDTFAMLRQTVPLWLRIQAEKERCFHDLAPFACFLRKIFPPTRAMIGASYRRDLRTALAMSWPSNVLSMNWRTRGQGSCSDEHERVRLRQKGIANRLPLDSPDEGPSEHSGMIFAKLRDAHLLPVEPPIGNAAATAIGILGGNEVPTFAFVPGKANC